MSATTVMHRIELSSSLDISFSPRDSDVVVKQILKTIEHKTSIFGILIITRTEFTIGNLMRIEYSHIDRVRSKGKRDREGRKLDDEEEGIEIEPDNFGVSGRMRGRDKGVHTISLHSGYIRK